MPEPHFGKLAHLTGNMTCNILLPLAQLVFMFTSKSQWKKYSIIHLHAAHHLAQYLFTSWIMY